MIRHHPGFGAVLGPPSLSASLKRTALRIPSVRRLYDRRAELAEALAAANRTIDELRLVDHRTLVERGKLEVEQAARMTELKERLARSEGLAARLACGATLDRPLAFMHVPKTSGNALSHGLFNVLPATRTVVEFDLSMFGNFRQFETMTPAVRAKIRTAGLPAADGADLVAGHFAYSTLISGRPDARLMTVLREPRSRILSHWMFWRAAPDEQQELWGAWAERLRLARKPLADFLRHPEIACQTDNATVRMLLWPHPLIPDDGFIDEASDQCLVAEAMQRLGAFAFADVVENPDLERALRAFLARPFVYPRLNETVAPAAGLRVSLQAELTDDAVALIEHRSRLDQQLWQAVVAERMPGVDAKALAEEVFAGTVARHSSLMAA